MSLLRKASIVTTPTAYENGKILSVKPNTSVGDFDFTRNSSATRVNSQGLIEDMQILSSNLVSNGDFATDSDWILSANADIQNNGLNLNGSGTFVLGQQPLFSSGLYNGKKVKLTYEVVANDLIGTGNLRVGGYSGGSLFPSLINLDESIGNHTIYTTINSTGSNYVLDLYITGGYTSGKITITNISVIEITDDTNLPRIDYTGGEGHWLFEPQSTNLLTYSEDFSQWNVNGDTAIESGYLAPDGTNNAYKVSGTSSAIVFDASLLTTTTRSIYARTVSGTGQAHLCSFNGNSNNLFTITEQWQRFEVNSATTTGVINFYAVDFRNQTNLSEIILWGANATNEQNFATSYIPTSGSQITRLADAAFGAGSSDLINSTEGVLYAEAATLVDPTGVMIIGLSDGTADNRISITFHSTLNRIQIFAQKNSVQLFNIDNTSVSKTNFNKIAISYSSTSAKFFLNGSLVASSTPSDMFSANILDRVNFDIGTGANKFFGKTKCVAVFKEALNNDELECLTGEGYETFNALALANNYTII